MGGATSEQCELARAALSQGCGWLTGMGLFIILFPSILDVIYIIGFCYVLKHTAALAKEPVQMSGVVMNTS